MLMKALHLLIMIFCLVSYIYSAENTAEQIWRNWQTYRFDDEGTPNNRKRNYENWFRFSRQVHGDTLQNNALVFVNYLKSVQATRLQKLNETAVIVDTLKHQKKTSWLPN